MRERLLDVVVVLISLAGTAVSGCAVSPSEAASPSVHAGKAELAQVVPAFTVKLTPLQKAHARVSVAFNSGAVDESLHGPYPNGLNATVGPREVQVANPLEPDWFVRDGYGYFLTDPTLRLMAEKGAAAGEAEPKATRPRLARTQRVRISTPNCRVIVWALSPPEGEVRERVFHCVDPRPGTDEPIAVTRLVPGPGPATVEIPEGHYVEVIENAQGVSILAPKAIPPRDTTPDNALEEFLQYVEERQGEALLNAPPWQ